LKRPSPLYRRRHQRKFFGVDFSRGSVSLKVFVHLPLLEPVPCKTEQFRTFIHSQIAALPRPLERLRVPGNGHEKNQNHERECVSHRVMPRKPAITHLSAMLDHARRRNR
jgi:hypothetical protein